jgi:hypothetical protein
MTQSESSRPEEAYDLSRDGEPWGEMNAISTSLLENNSERLVHPGAEASSFGGLTCNTNEIKEIHSLLALERQWVKHMKRIQK